MARPTSPRARRTGLAAGLVLVGALTACGDTPDRAVPQEDRVADLADLTDGWNRIAAEEPAVCSDGSPYHFYVRPGDPERVLFYLEGGGACWNGGTCDPDLQPSYTVNLSQTDPTRAHGIFAFDEAANPFANHTVVMAPYCSGDVHLGRAQVIYQAPATDDHEPHEVTVRHQGARNVRAVLDWTQTHLFRPREIFVTGSSAGAIPSPVYASILARHYLEARVTQLGDGAGGYRGLGAQESQVDPAAAWDVLSWLETETPFSDISADEFSFEALYTAAAGFHPDITFARFDTAEDSVQLGFLQLGGIDAPSLMPLLEENRAEIEAEADNVVSYVAGGGVHTILLRPEFYRFAVGDVTVRDWVGGLAAGDPVGSVICRECAAAETVPPPVN